MIMDKIEKILNEEINYSCDDGFARVDILGTEYAAERIVKLLIPTLNWKDNPNVSFSTGGGHMCVIRKTDDTYTTTMPVGFTGTLDECKHYCSVWVRDEYLKLCGNG